MLGTIDGRRDSNAQKHMQSQPLSTENDLGGRGVKRAKKLYAIYNIISNN